ncbi:tryptophanyl-tRNA synthetase II [Lacticaseibacillus sharpeae JCM 1186 = DSM 20505]|uniref:Tryptophan--tRNA ligase n=2 Tax=Lacticaseibacillus sharpeae TaxID=1626 RepID=A0A0R1ZM10_9LACO|nr:tryptophanyl-tRNA synthetase II [Lacticaseibacillus sharpeae JCM 1186 = DSM 20505]
MLHCGKYRVSPVRQTNNGELIMAKKIILTGDRPTGRLHIGHYIGSLKNRVALQNSGDYESYIMIADLQALTDNARNPEKIRKSLLEVALDYLAVGIDPAKSTILVQSQIPALSELTMYYLDLVSVNRLNRNPTVKTEIAQKAFGESVPAGFLIYPVSQAADITAFKADTVPVGDDQEPMLEQTREIVRTFNRTYNTDCLVEPEGYFPPKGSGRLPGIDGNAKMSKSLGNGIYLADDADTVQKKIMSMYTDPNHIHVEDPGQIEGNVVFTYLDMFGTDKAKIAELKEHYQAGGLGDVKIKRYLVEVMEAVLEPIRTRRLEYAKDMDAVAQMLKDGSAKANLVAEQTLAEVRAAIGVNYF